MGVLKLICWGNRISALIFIDVTCAIHFKTKENVRL